MNPSAVLHRGDGALRLTITILLKFKKGRLDISFDLNSISDSLQPSMAPQSQEQEYQVNSTAPISIGLCLPLIVHEKTI